MGWSQNRRAKQRLCDTGRAGHLLRPALEILGFFRLHLGATKATDAKNTTHISQPDLVMEWSETQEICRSAVTSCEGGPAEVKAH